MSLVDCASSSDDDVPEPTEEERSKKEEPQPSPPRSKTKSGSSSNQQLENKPHSSPPSAEKLPDASLLLDAPTVSSNLMSASDHLSRVAAAQAENASRKRDSNGMASSTVRSKVPRANLPHSRNVPETSGSMLVPPQISGRMEAAMVEAELVLPSYLSFKRVQMYDKYPKGQARGRHWKHLKQIIQAENYQNYPPDEPNYVNIESPPSMHPCKRICDITGFEAPYYDPRTNLRYANAEVFKIIRSLPNEYVQRYLAQRNAATVLK